MLIHVLTLFPDMVKEPFEHSMMKRAQENGCIDLRFVDIRDFTTDKHKNCDDRPYGGGPGMVMMIEPIYNALQSCKTAKSKVILLSPKGEVFRQKIAKDLSQEEHLIFICGHYEGIDERVRTNLVDMELSIGDYILTNGAIASLVVIDACVRLIPGVLGSEDSLTQESFSNDLLEYPQFTRPRSFLDHEVPDILFSGNHKEIQKYRDEQSLKKTLLNRPELSKKIGKEK